MPVAGYAGWYSRQHGAFEMTDSTGVFLYSRVMTFADCSRMPLPADLVSLCTPVPPDQRPIAQAYIWTPPARCTVPAPMFSPRPTSSPSGSRPGHRGTAARLRARGVGRHGAVFEWNRSVFPNPQTYDEYLFGYQSVPIPVTPCPATRRPPPRTGVAATRLTVVVNPFAQVIRGYQRYVWLPGTVYGLMLLVGLLGIAAGRGGRRGGEEAGCSRGCARWR